MLIILPNTFGDAATNMAIDAALLERLPDQIALFRHYGWAEPAITFGYSQRFEEVVIASPEGATLCRRASGGGIVDHRNDWTYALILHKGLEAAQKSSTELYQNIHESISAALQKEAVVTRLAPCPRHCAEAPVKTTGPDQCFVQPSMNDVLAENGSKIAGAAMKRTRKGLLIQGSIDRASLPDDLDYQAFQNHFIAELSESLPLPLHQPDDLRPFFNSEMIEEEKQKFSSDEWKKRR